MKENMNNEIVDKIGNIRAKLVNLQPDDKDSIIEVGAALEQAESELSETTAVVGEAVRLCLEALQAFYEQTVSAPQLVLQSASEVLAAIERYFTSEDSANAEEEIKQATSRLADVLQQDTSQNSASELEQDTSESQTWTLTTLDDVAALLLQAEPGDVDKLAQIRDALNQIASTQPLSTSSADLVAKAISKLEEALNGDTDVNDELLTEIGNLIGAAMEDEEMTYMSEPSVSEPSHAEINNQDASEQLENTQSLPADADVDLIRDFVTESSEYIQKAEAALLALETDPENADAINTVFRAFHTIKGTSAFLGLAFISELAHRAESLLSRIRDGEIRCAGGYADLALRS